MLSPRWRKVVRDLWGNKLRTILVVLSIAVGVFAVGMIAGTRATAVTALDASWNSTNPASVTLYTDLFDEELLYTVRHMPGVQEADARRADDRAFPECSSPRRDRQRSDRSTARRTTRSGATSSLYAYPDYEAIRVGKVWPQSGAWPPPERQILIERASLDWMGVAGRRHGAGQSAERPPARAAHRGHGPRSRPDAGLLERHGDRLRRSRHAGLARRLAGLRRAPRDRGRRPTSARSELTQLAQELRTKVEKSGRTVYYTYIPTPGKHPAGETVEPMLMILGVLGFLALILSGFLVVNTMQALLTQQVRQMGIMKAIGARNGQIMGIYWAWCWPSACSRWPSRCRWARWARKA